MNHIFTINHKMLSIHANIILYARYKRTESTYLKKIIYFSFISLYVLFRLIFNLSIVKVYTCTKIYALRIIVIEMYVATCILINRVKLIRPIVYCKTDF